MKTSLKSVLLSSVLGLTVAAMPQAAFAKKKEEEAPAATGVIKGIGVANPQYIVGASAAYKYADQLRPTHFKAYYDSAAQRKAQIEAQLQPMYDKLEKDSQNPKADPAALQKLAVQVRQIEQAGEQELQTMIAPVSLSDQYVIEQISDKLEQAIKQAKARRGVSIVLDGRSIVDADEAYDMDQDVIAELNVLIPVPQLDPPQGWMPRAQREAAARQAQAQGGQAPAGAPAPAPAPRGAAVPDDGRGN